MAIEREKRRSTIDERKRHFGRRDSLRKEYESYGHKDKHQQITDFLYTQGGRYTDAEAYPNDGKRRDEKIIDSTAGIAMRALVAFMWGGVVDPTSNWFGYGTANKALKEIASVREYFEAVTKTTLTDLSDSNFYTSAESVLAEMIAFGTSAVQIEPGRDKVYRFISYTMGEYYFDEGPDGAPDSIYREFSMRARNVVEKFGEENVTETTRDKARGDKPGMDWVKILHVQERNYDRNPELLDAENKEWRSTYYEEKSSVDHPPLMQGGTDTQPFAVPRWSKAGSATWGTGPGELALGDIMGLQTQAKLGLKATAKGVQPAMYTNAPNNVTINAGANGLTRMGQSGGSAGPILKQAYEVNVNQNDLRLDKNEAQARIRSVFYADLIFLLSGADNKQKTATEVIQTQRELIRLLGPIIQRLFPEYLRIVLKRCFDIGNKLGRYPEPPQEIRGQEVKIEINSLIAQAQKQTIVSPIEQLVSFTVNMSQAKPDILDKIDFDQVVDSLHEVLGTPADIVKSDEVVAEERAEKARIMSQQFAAQNMQGAANTAKTLSQADTGGDNALTALAS